MSKYVHEISESEAYNRFKIRTVYHDGGGAQVSYNLPLEFFNDCIKEKILIKSNLPIYSFIDNGVVYELNSNYNFILGINALKILGSKFSKEGNVFFVVDTTSNRKIQLFRSNYDKISKTNKKYEWFVELYRKNVKGNIIELDINALTRELVFEIGIQYNYADNMPILKVKESFELIKPMQKIYFGSPGTGKSYNVTKEIQSYYPQYKSNSEIIKNIFRTTIHPEYTYYDFVGSILPVVKQNNDSTEAIISYNFSPGIFTQAYKCAIDTGEHVFLVLEEMSRGNIAAIFGDIFQLLDRDNSGNSEYEIKNDLIAMEVFNNPDVRITMPSNLSIIGTVNNSDQNVYVMDTAFKRRFDFVYVDFEPLKDDNQKYINDFEFNLHDNTNNIAYKISWIKFYLTFNDFITNELNLSEDKQIGQFFIKFDGINDFSKITDKLLLYIWNDIVKTSDSRVSLLRNDIKSFRQAYKELSNRKNIFSQDFIVKFTTINTQEKYVE